MKTLLITQARMTSTRLPGKVMKTILGKSLLEFHVKRLQECRSIDALVVATPTDLVNEPIWSWCENQGVSYFKGDEQDVLSRYAAAARIFDGQLIVRVTSDCPLIDPKVLDEALQLFRSAAPPYDYVSNTLERTFPRGLDVEVFSRAALDQAAMEATASGDREHVTPYIWRQPKRFKLGSLMRESDESRRRWTVDTIEDFKFMETVLSALYPVKPRFSTQDVLAYLKQHPEVDRLNAHVQQKTVI